MTNPEYRDLPKYKEYQSRYFKAYSMSPEYKEYYRNVHEKNPKRIEAKNSWRRVKRARLRNPLWRMIFLAQGKSLIP